LRAPPIQQLRAGSIGRGVLRNQFGGEVEIEIAQNKVTLGVLRGDELRRSAHVLEGLTDPFQEKTDCPMTQRSTYWFGQSSQ
jgi:hypothetical protein